MTIFHHRNISKAIHKYVEQKLDVKLDKTAFIVGSFFPDMPFVLRRISHNKNGSWEFIKELINEQYKLEFKSKSILTKKSSLNMGIIIHFVSDYFCYYHNESGDILSHIKYESFIHKRFKKFDYAVLDDIFDSALRKSRLFSDTKELVDCYHNKYLLFPKSARKDIVYSLGIPAAVVFSILNSMVAQIQYAA